MILGAHVSIAGGVSNAPIRAKRIGCETMQIFTKNQMQWKIPELTEDEIKKFKFNITDTGIIPGTVHSSYLVNLSSPDSKTLIRSINDLSIDLERAEALNIKYLVFHPGAHKGRGEDYALKRIVESIDEVFEKSHSKKTLLLLETTAGEGTNVGYKFEHLDYIIQHIKNPGRVGVCIDTCHIFAAGYDIRTEKAYKEVMRKIDLTFGIETVKAVHLNDSKKDLGSYMDRHEEIGNGKIGLKAFDLLVNDDRLKNVFGILETPGGEEGYKRNLNILKNLRR
jgi:deoxyribonuclease-4